MHPYGTQLLTVPTIEPITTTEAKAFLRVDDSDEDSLIDALIKSARKYTENFIDKALITQTWVMWMDGFPRTRNRGSAEPWWDGVREGAISSLHNKVLREIFIPKAPLQSITSVITIDPEDAETTFSAVNYIVDIYSPRGRIVLRDGGVWPSDLREANAVKITFITGYGDAASAIPDDIITAMKQLIAHWFEHREAVSESSMTEVPMTVKLLLDSYKLVQI